MKLTGIWLESLLSVGAGVDYAGIGYLLHSLSSKSAFEAARTFSLTNSNGKPWRNR